MADEQQEEEFKVTGADLMERVKNLIKEGNARRIIIKNEAGENVLEIPLTWGAVGTVLAPSIAAIGAVVALLSKCTIVVVKK